MIRYTLWFPEGESGFHSSRITSCKIIQKRLHFVIVIYIVYGKREEEPGEGRRVRVRERARGGRGRKGEGLWGLFDCDFLLIFASSLLLYLMSLQRVI